MKRSKAAILMVAALVMAAPMAGAEQWTFNVEPGGKLEVDLDTGGDIVIRGGDSPTVTVEADVHGRDAEWVLVEAEKTSQGVEVQSQFTRKMRSSSAGVELVITVPAKFDLEIESMGGKIEIANVEGEIEGETMGGALKLSGLRGRIHLSTMGGEIEVLDTVAAGEVSTMGGDVVFRNVSSGLKGSTMGGQMRVEGEAEGGGPETTQVVRISSMGGSIKVADAPAGAKVSTMGGEIRIGSARGFVDAKTMGGDVEIREVDGRVKASTMGGDVSVRVVGAGGEVEIESLSGEIELTLPAGFSASFDVELDYTRNSRRSFEIRSDFPLQQSETPDWSHSGGTPRKTIRGEGKSGDGRHKVRIRTINGDVVIRKGG